MNRRGGIPDPIEILHEISGVQRTLLGVDREEVVDGLVYRRAAWVDPCVECRREVVRRTWFRLRPGVPAVIRPIEEKISNRCSGCDRDAWQVRRR